MATVNSFGHVSPGSLALAGEQASREDGPQPGFSRCCRHGAREVCVRPIRGCCGSWQLRAKGPGMSTPHRAVRTISFAPPITRQQTSSSFQVPIVARHRRQPPGASLTRGSILALVLFLSPWAVFVSTLATRASAATYYWAPSSGNWSVASNWGGTVTSSDYACISNGGTATITLTSATCYGLDLGVHNTTQGGTILMTSGSLNCSTYETVGQGYGQVTFNQAGGTNQTNVLYVGWDGQCSSATYVLSGGQLYANWELAGESGLSGSFSQSGGSNIVGELDLSSNARYTLSDTGQISANDEKIGIFGSATFTQTGGTNALLGGPLELAVQTGSSGIYSLSTTGLLSGTGGIYIGRQGAGTFNQTGGTVSGYLYFGDQSSAASGIYNLSGGLCIVSAISIGPGTRR